MERVENMDLFDLYLLERENAPATIRKYKTDVRTFFVTWMVIRKLRKNACCSIRTG